ncbi:MAG: serine/threonine protein kinase [Acidobacteriota bacterium]|nr:serine/threonine protein kinase [Acidobacteriota bacterium]
MSRPDLINSTVGEYCLVDFLGAGGMGDVYRGVHSKIGRVAAIKVLTQTANTGGFVERFFNEARIQASLQHPNIATLYDFLEFDGQPCIIMEYVDGQTLADRIRPVGPLPLAETLRVFRAVVEAVGYIHGYGIIHRDIKSNNIKISSTGQVKLLDFGIAKGSMSPGLTETGSVIGTLEYISPEQLASGIADPRSDIWALGVLLYEMTTGHVPFEAQTLGALCTKISKADYLPPAQLNPAIPREITAVITRCLKKNPAERYQTAEALLQDISRINVPITPPHDSYSAVGTDARPSDSWAKRNWLKLSGVAVIACMFLIFAVAGTYFAMSSGEDGPAQPSAAGAAAPGQSSPPKGEAARAGTRTVTVDMSDGPAEIWRGEQRLGTMKSTKLDARLGERVTLTLKREGHEPRIVSFDVTENKKVYTFSMSK